MTTAEQVAADALQLTDEERAALAELLWDSLYGPEDEPEDLAQILAERSAASRDGGATFRDPMEIVDVYARMKERRSDPEG